MATLTYWLADPHYSVSSEHKSVIRRKTRKALMQVLESDEYAKYDIKKDFTIHKKTINYKDAFDLMLHAVEDFV